MRIRGLQNVNPNYLKLLIYGRRPSNLMILECFVVVVVVVVVVIILSFNLTMNNCLVSAKIGLVIFCREVMCVMGNLIVVGLQSTHINLENGSLI